MLTILTALIVVSLGGFISFTTTGSIDTMSSEAAATINATASTFTLFIPVLVIIVLIVAVVCMVCCTRAF